MYVHGFLYNLILFLHFTWTDNIIFFFFFNLPMKILLLNVVKLSKWPANVNHSFCNSSHCLVWRGYKSTTVNYFLRTSLLLHWSQQNCCLMEKFICCEAICNIDTSVGSFHLFLPQYTYAHLDVFVFIARIWLCRLHFKSLGKNVQSIVYFLLRPTKEVKQLIC